MSAQINGPTCLDNLIFNQPKTSLSKSSVVTQSRLGSGRFRACLKIVSQQIVLLSARLQRDGAYSLTPRCKLISGLRTATRKTKSKLSSQPMILTLSRARLRIRLLSETQ